MSFIENRLFHEFNGALDFQLFFARLKNRLMSKKLSGYEKKTKPSSSSFNLKTIVNTGYPFSELH